MRKRASSLAKVQKELGRRIKEAREAAGMTQEESAAHGELLRQMVQSILRFR